jgi:hypothetical protein
MRIQTLISTFKDIQAANEVPIIQRNAGGTIRPKAKRYRDIDSRLIQLKEHLTSNFKFPLLSYIWYINKICNCV